MRDSHPASWWSRFRTPASCGEAPRKHHVGAKDTHYCVVTNVLNPVLDVVRFWHWLEWAIERLLGVATRSSLEVGPVERQVGFPPRAS